MGGAAANYPADFESLFGSITDESFKEPEKLPAEADAKRESF